MRVAVIGGGIVGLSCAKALIDRGADAVVYERGDLMAERSSGDSRIFRLAHREAQLVHCALESLDVLRAWEVEAGRSLLNPTGAVITGKDTSAWAAAMREAGAPFEEHDASASLRLPIPARPEPSLVDPSGGVALVDTFRTFLSTEVADIVRRAAVASVTTAGSTVQVASSSGTDEFDVAVIAAGVSTPMLAATAEMYLPTQLAHHFRFTFRLRQPTDHYPAWITDIEGLSTYQHLNAPGQWAVGGHIDPAAVAWEVGKTVARQRSRDAVLGWVRKHLPMVEPEVIDEVHCSTNPTLGDGFSILRNGPVLAIHGENLFKLAPALGHRLAKAILTGDTPASVR